MLRKKCPDRRFERCQCASCAREACGCLYLDKLEMDCPIQNCVEYKSTEPGTGEVRQMKMEEVMPGRDAQRRKRG